MVETCLTIDYLTMKIFTNKMNVKVKGKMTFGAEAEGMHATYEVKNNLSVTTPDSKQKKRLGQAMRAAVETMGRPTLCYGQGELVAFVGKEEGDLASLKIAMRKNMGGK